MPLPEKFYVQITNPVSGLRWFTAFGSSSFSISSWVAEGLVIRESAYGPQNPSLENCRDARLLRRSDFIASGAVSAMFKAEQDIADKWEGQDARFLSPGCPQSASKGICRVLTWEVVSRDVGSLLVAYKALKQDNLDNLDVRLIFSELSPGTREEILNAALAWKISPAKAVARILEQTCRRQRIA